MPQFSTRSHDGYEDVDGVLEARSNKYATQRKVFDNLGQGVLDNAFEGKFKKLLNTILTMSACSIFTTKSEKF